MYDIGTVTTTANSPKITGTGTRWKDNTTLVSVGQVIVIKSGSANTPNELNVIYSIENNTSLTLKFPVSAKLTNATYTIATTMIDSISDGVNKATAQVIASEIFTDIFTELMTGTGTLEFELPNGQKVKLRTEHEKDKLLDGKLNSSGNINLTKGVLTIFNPLSSLLRLVVDEDNSNYISFFKNGKTDSANRTAVIGYGDKDIEEFQITNSKANRTIVIHRDGVRISGKGEVLTIGDYGIGNPTPLIGALNISLSSIVRAGSFIQQYSVEATLEKEYPYDGLAGTLINYPSAGAKTLQEYRVYNRPQFIYYRSVNTNGSSKGEPWVMQYNTGNTTKDAQGNLRAASPIVKVFADHIETNDESEGVTLEKLGVGRYKLKGVLGMNSDASWGGFNGGIVIPKGINGLELVWADYKVLADGDIILETHYRKHSDLPPPVVLNRLIAYPEFMDENGNELESYTPCDIPNGHWIDIRVQMPSNSIYNQKQAEAERLAKIEAERLAQEEAKRIAEEAERAEQEAEVQAEQQ
ncbi:pyocin knob domain-containing protein [Providencia vermicola]|uniref:pyocin knob domain-containing protein n=1 Tax=Providencia vermicola TaxID=333965 RepID=UPI003D2BF8F4